MMDEPALQDTTLPNMMDEIKQLKEEDEKNEGNVEHFSTMVVLILERRIYLQPLEVKEGRMSQQGKYKRRLERSVVKLFEGKIMRSESNNFKLAVLAFPKWLVKQSLP